MSTHLRWRPKGGGRTLDDDLKRYLRNRYGDPIKVILTRADLDYLTGLSDAYVTGATKLIDAIEQYEEIEVEEVE